MPIQSHQVRFGRIVKNVSEPILPLTLAADAQNVDMDETGAASKRKGYQHAIDEQLTGRIALIAGWDDYTDDQNFIIIDGVGVHKES